MNFFYLLIFIINYKLKNNIYKINMVFIKKKIYIYIYILIQPITS